MARANVPKFGNWENEDNVPYTVYFDKARKNKGGKPVNPNDPEENPDMFPMADPSPLSPPRAQPRTRSEAPEHSLNKEELNASQFGNPQARNENLNQRAVNEQSYGAHRQKPARPARPSGGSDQGLDRSPLHPNHKGGGRSYESGHGSTPGRSHQKSPTRLGDESPEKGAAVPKFGAWNVGDPQSAEEFTDIFNKVREERNAKPGNASNTPKHPSYTIQPAKQPKKCNCFGW